MEITVSPPIKKEIKGFVEFLDNKKWNNLNDQVLERNFCST